MEDKQALFKDFALILRVFYGFYPEITVKKQMVEFKIPVILTSKMEFEYEKIGV